MFKDQYFDKDQMIDWRREAKEEVKTKRFCPNCFQLVELKLREHKHYQNFYACTICGELVLTKGTIRYGGSQGYGERHRQRYSQRT